MPLTFSSSTLRFASRRSLVAAVLAAAASIACGESTAGPAPSTPASLGTTYTSEIAISATSWRNVGEGELTLVRIDASDSFPGELACYSSPGPACGNGAMSEADLGPKIYTRRAPAPGEILGDGAVPAGRILCCGALSGAGGKATVSYMK